jgi:hypothetical protein
VDEVGAAAPGVPGTTVSSSKLISDIPVSAGHDRQRSYQRADLAKGLRR